MKHYLTLIRKSDFTDLFRFGYAYIDKSRIVEFDGQIEKLSDNEAIKDKLFAFPNPMDYSFTVLIIHFSHELDENGFLSIENVQNLYALDEQAKKEIEISYDPRIKIQNPIWPDAFKELENRFFFEDLKKGSKNIWTILDITTPIHEVKDILSDNDIKTLITYMGDDIKLDGNHSFWMYLLHYQRHAFFPKNSLGFFFDLINVYLNTHKGQELPGEITENTNIYHILEQTPTEFQNSFIKIIDYLSETQDGRNFLDKISEIADGNIDAPKIAVLFLKFKEQFRDNFNLSPESKNILDYSFKSFTKETPYALYLLGTFLGNSHTFECLYDTLPLPIFKPVKVDENMPEPVTVDEEEASQKTAPFLPKIEEEPVKNNQQDVIQKEDTEKVVPQTDSISMVSQPGLFDDDSSLVDNRCTTSIDNHITTSFPLLMRKSNRGNPKTVNSLKEYEKLLKQGYKIVNK